MRLLRTLAPLACVSAAVLAMPLATGKTAKAADRSRPVLQDSDVFCRLYLDATDKFTRVLAPRRAASVLNGPLNADANLSTITVNYTGFTSFPAAQTAFQAAVDIWKTQVASTVPIVIDAQFTDLGGTGGTGTLLGQAGSGSVRDFTGAPRAGTWFPFPLANKLAGTDTGAQFGPGTSDIGAEFNSNPNVNWYFGTDGLTPSAKIDFESVVLHELGHGLGFLGGSAYSSGTGTLGSGGFPYIYDTFTIDSALGGTPLLNYPNPSTALGTAFTSNSIYWMGATGVANNSFARPKLYAPSTYSQGSTYSHLDEATYPAGNINSLMTPFLGTAEAVHNPGPIMLGMFADMGWTVGSSCTYSLSSSGVTVGTSATSGSVTLTTQTGCAWTASSGNTSIATITSAASGTGSATINYNVLANTAVNQRSVNLTIGGQIFTITQNGTGPTMTLDRTSLVFAGVNTGASFSAVTAPQTVRMTQAGTGTISWTATASQPWIHVMPASGSGTATLTISTVFAFGLAGAQAGTVSLAFTGAGNTAGPITVTLNSIQNGTSLPPFGSFDTPMNGSTGIAGSIAVTGWALDDVQVTRLTICRDAVLGEAGSVDLPDCAGNAKIYIGDAIFIDGARPDVQAVDLSAPLNSRGGWGYLMLTNFLPNLGNGTFAIYAYAYDADGHTTQLGTKTITCNNATAFAPFGSIDTPAQGAVVSGAAYGNTGWVLAQGPNRADPPGGGTVNVYVDGNLVGAPSLWNTRSDLQMLFPASSYPGIGTALGIYGLNTTTLTNGIHTIFWIATGTGPSGTSGIGSRFITVSNGSDTLGAAAAGANTSGVIAANGTLDVPAAAAARIASPQMLDSEVAAAPADLGSVPGRRGYDLDSALQTYTPSSGRIDVQAEELDRIELHLSRTSNHHYSGYLHTPSGLRPLPVGSTLNASTGAFTWTPGVGFYGSYDLTFVRWGGGHAVARQDVRITLNAQGSNRVGPQTIIDAPGENTFVGSPFYVGGWAADLTSSVDSGVSTVHVWAYPVDRSGNRLDPIFLGPAIYGGARPDVAAVYGARFSDSGYGIIVSTLPPGTYDIAVFSYSTVVNNFTPAKVVRVTVR